MHLLRDLRYAARGLRRAPALLIVGTLSLGVGIAAMTTLWAGIDTLFLRPLPYDRDGTLLFVGTAEERWHGPSSPSAMADFLDLRESATTVRLAAYRDRGVNLGRAPAEWVAGRHVSGEFFDVVGVRARHGRLFTGADESPSSEPVAVLSHGLWAERFGGDASVVGRSVAVDGEAVTVVGVLPEGFEFGFNSPDLWLPLRVDGAADRASRSVAVIGRMRRPLATVRAELATLAAGLATAYPATNEDRTFLANGVREEWFGGGAFGQGAVASLVAAALVLLVACVNVANLLLARGAARSEEIAVRRSLGAGRGRLFRQLLAEAALLAAAGGVLGVLLSLAGLRGLRALMPGGLPRASEVGLDARVLGVALAVAALAALLAGVLPAARTLRSAPARVVGGRSDGVRGGGGRLRSVLVGAEVALAMVLLATTTLVIRSVELVHEVDTGFRTAGVVTFTVNLPDNHYADDDARRLAATRLEEAVAAVPGVVSSGVGVGVPARAWRSARVRRPESPDDEGQSVIVRYASPGYLETIGLAPLRGRPLSPGDDAAAPAVALVNERVAGALWADEDPVGRVLHVGEEAVQVAGVVPDVREWGPTFPPRPTLYLPLAQWPSSRLDFVLAGADEGTLITGARAAVTRIDPTLAVHGEAMLEDVIMGPAEQYVAMARLLAVLAGAALLLAVVGVYGSMAYAVARRVPEIGLRMAIGADAAAIRRMVLGGAGRVAGAGVAVGLLLAFGASRGIGAFLFGVGATDPVAFVAVPALLVAVSLAAAWVPARRASRVDPMRSLRAE